MIGHTSNDVLVDASLDFVWDRTNDVADWPNLFSEYASAEILEREGDTTTFRLTMFPDEQGRIWSWVSRRTVDRGSGTVRAKRVEPGPFEFMDITWTYEAVSVDRTRMTWTQDFRMKPTAPIDTAAMTDRINLNTRIQMDLIKARLEAQRRCVIGFSDVPPNRRRGGDLRAMVTPQTAGTTSGFCGAARLAPGESVAEHYHPYSEEFLYVTSGRLRVDLDSEPIEVDADHALCIPRTVRHRLTNIGPDDVLAVFHLSPLAPEPRLGHVDTEEGPVPAEPTPAERMPTGPTVVAG